MSVVLAGIGTALPPHAFDQAEAAELHATFCLLDAERRRTLRVLYRKSGVTSRRSVVLQRSEGPLAQRQDFYRPAKDADDAGPPTAARMKRYESCAPVLAKQAAARALSDAGVAANRVTHLVTVSCTGFMAPGLDARLVQGLGLEPDVSRTHVGFMGCHGALNGLRVAHAVGRSDADSAVLVCAVELCSLHFAYGWDADMMVANALFADGAAAVVARPALPGGPAAWSLEASGTLLLDDSADDMTWRIGDHGFRMTLSARVPELIRARLGPWLEEWLGQHGLAPAQIATWAVHPGGPRILSAVEGALGLSPEHTAVSREVLAEMGNMSSATILFILERLRARHAPRPCVALAFGPGLVVEAALLR